MDSSDRRGWRGILTCGRLLVRVYWPGEKSSVSSKYLGRRDGEVIIEYWLLGKVRSVVNIEYQSVEDGEFVMNIGQRAMVWLLANIGEVSTLVLPSVLLLFFLSTQESLALYVALPEDTKSLALSSAA